MLKLGEMSYGMYELGEVSFEMLKLGDLRKLKKVELG